MPKFYDMHDSLLESIEQDGERVSINLRAVRSEIEQGPKHLSNLFRQEIRLVFEGAELSVDAPNLPSWLLEGGFRCDTLDADQTDCAVVNTIPVSLRSAHGVELVLSGIHEGSGAFVTIRVKANSLTVAQLGEPEHLQYTRATI